MKTTRREFVCGVGYGAAALTLHGCTGIAHARDGSDSAAMAGASQVRDLIGAERERILAAAARAPSTHNSQPWRVRVLAADEWTIGADPSRRLPAVDPLDRELALSLGAFIEYLVTGAAALGFVAHLEELRGATLGADLVRVRLSRKASGTRRGTARSHRPSADVAQGLLERAALEGRRRSTLGTIWRSRALAPARNEAGRLARRCGAAVVPAADVARSSAAGACAVGPLLRRRGEHGHGRPHAGQHGGERAGRILHA